MSVCLIKIVYAEIAAPFEAGAFQEILTALFENVVVGAAGVLGREAARIYIIDESDE